MEARGRSAEEECRDRGSEGRVAQENAWKCIPRSEGVPVERNRKIERNARKGGGGRDRGRDWDAEDIIRVEKPTPRTVTEKLCLILPVDPASAIVILHFAGCESVAPFRRLVPIFRRVCLPLAALCM